MRAKMLIPVLAVVFGVAGGVLRGWNLTTGYEVDTLLPIAGNHAQTGLIALSAVAAVLFLLLAVGQRKAQLGSFEQVFGGKHTGFQTISVISGFVMMVCGAGGLYAAFSANKSSSFFAQVAVYPQWILAILCGVSIIGLTAALGKGELTSSSAPLALIPMFWAAFDLVVTFQSNSASPFLGYYAFELLASIFLSYAFYLLAALLYATPKPLRLLFAGAMAIVFGLTCSIGGLIAWLQAGEIWQMELGTVVRYGCLAASSVWMIGLQIRLASER